MVKPKEMGVPTPEQYVSRTSKAADTQDLNTGLVYDLIILKRVLATSIFADLL